MPLHALLHGHFDIDTYLNPYLPPSPLPHLPSPIAHFLGHRTTASTPSSTLTIYLYAFLGAFASITALCFVRLAPGLTTLHPPLLIASFGASAILTFQMPDAPVAQPRSLVGGHTLATLVGVAIVKLFALSPAVLDAHRWAAAALACAIASVLMGATKTVHPPAGATALLPASEAALGAMGWGFVALVVVCAGVDVVLGCVLMNLQRRWPVWWWSPAETGAWWARKGKADVEMGPGGEQGKQVEEEEKSAEVPPHVLISTDALVVPDGLQLDQFEREVLQGLQARLAETSISRETSSTTTVGA